MKMMMCSRKILDISCLAVCTLLVSVACNRNVFDADYYKEITEVAQPVKGIDKTHQWDITSTQLLSVDVRTAHAGMERLQILSGNPAVEDHVTVLADWPLSGSEREYVGFTAPNTLSQFYAALIDEQGTYTITAFHAGQRSINFSEPVANQVPVESRRLEPQTFTYCFEDEMPEPGDYDYNDVVLRISQERPAANQLVLHVTLAAVGSDTQVAAAVRLADVSYDDIADVTTLDGKTFNENYRMSALPYTDGTKLLVRGLNGEAVVNIFEDAHWASGAISYTSEGYIPRLRYNVAKAVGTEFDFFAPRTISYVITFKNPALLNYFTLASLDPFAIVEYNGVLMETHAVYKYRRTAVLHEFSIPDNAVILPWGLVVPSASFRNPLEGVNIGFSKDGVLFGAYMTAGHSFGEWAANQKAACDWYNYPTENQVY